jgi:non-ribosomal peptide synthetase component E (peptide arylation enzyme)
MVKACDMQIYRRKDDSEGRYKTRYIESGLACFSRPDRVQTLEWP